MSEILRFTDQELRERGDYHLTLFSSGPVVTCKDDPPDSWDAYLAHARCPECGGAGYLLPGARTALRHVATCRFRRRD
jgi:hypothetical protein